MIPSAILKSFFAIFFFVFSAVWALTSGGFRIVSDTFINISLRNVVSAIEMNRRLL